MSEAAALREQTIALAAVVQAALLVDQLAREGSAPADELQNLCASLFCFEWSTVEDVFHGRQNLQRGFITLEQLLTRFGTPEHAAVLRQTLSITHLARILARDRARMTQIRAGLEQLAPRANAPGTSYIELAPQVAALYQETISTCSYRIQVAGKPTQLQDARNAERIRMILMAGLRAAVLWRHLGGGRIATFLGRARIIGYCRDLRANSH